MQKAIAGSKPAALSLFLLKLGFFSTMAKTKKKLSKHKVSNREGNKHTQAHTHTRRATYVTSKMKKGERKKK